MHLMGWQNDLLAAYTRLVPAGVSYEEMSIGRVVTSPKMRKSGAGRQLMQKSIESCYQLFGRGPFASEHNCTFRGFMNPLVFNNPAKFIWKMASSISKCY